MIKNILSVIVFLLSTFFLFFVGNIYFSDKYKKKINSNRIKITEKIENNFIGLPFLPNDTNNVIEFNTGFNNDYNKTKRNFWKLFKKWLGKQ